MMNKMKTKLIVDINISILHNMNIVLGGLYPMMVYIKCRIQHKPIGFAHLSKTLHSGGDGSPVATQSQTKSQIFELFLAFT